MKRTRQAPTQVGAVEVTTRMADGSRPRREPAAQCDCCKVFAHAEDVGTYWGRILVVVPNDGGHSYLICAACVERINAGEDFLEMRQAFADEYNVTD